MWCDAENLIDAYQLRPGHRGFTLRVHEEDINCFAEKCTDPLEIIADQAETDVLCFDEFLLLILPMPLWSDESFPVRPRY